MVRASNLQARLVPDRRRVRERLADRELGRGMLQPQENRTTGGGDIGKIAHRTDAISGCPELPAEQRALGPKHFPVGADGAFAFQVPHRSRRAGTELGGTLSSMSQTALPSISSTSFWRHNSRRIFLISRRALP